ncbi:MAG: glycosyltransferase [Bacteroidales bacterium]|nr:glycosyltransferase [Bacteroidales bacterium]
MAEFKPANKLKFLYYRFLCGINYLMELLNPSQIKDYKKIPVIINNFNRLSYMKQLIESLEKRGYTNIFIIDNLSTYPPLLEYYKTCRYTVFRLESNIGMNALWGSGLIKKFRKDYFVYTDSDMVPVEECPDDFMLFFLKVLRKNKFAQKVGFSLKIDDLPDSYALKDTVIEAEKQYYQYQHGDILYWAPIATTFALYRPRARRIHGDYYIEMYRTGWPYMARHLPWYMDSSNPDEENSYYLSQKLVATWYSKEYKKYLSRSN